jgi:hypothetical protein
MPDVNYGRFTRIFKLYKAVDENWYRKSDGKQLELKPGKYTLQVGFSIIPANQHTGLAISKLVQFEVIKTDYREIL